MSDFISNLLVRCGLVVVRYPPIEKISDPAFELLMAYHRCRKTGRWQYSKLYDYLSQNERFVCADCGECRRVKSVFGISRFLLAECKRVAREKNSWVPFPLRVIGLILGGLEKHLPKDRGGKTAGELESQAIGKTISSFAYFSSVIRP